MQLACLGGNTGRRVAVLRMHVVRMHAKRSACTRTALAIALDCVRNDSWSPT